jgi:hypothetical protein
LAQFLNQSIFLIVGSDNWTRGSGGNQSNLSHDDEILELILGERAREELFLGDEQWAVEVVHVGERAAHSGLHEPDILAGALPGARVRDAADHW